MKYEVAGDPVSGLRWTRKTTKKIAAELSALGIRVSRKTVAKLLKQMNFSLRTNKKKISNGWPTRDAPITQLRERFSRLECRHQEERVGRTLQEPRTRLGSKELPSTLCANIDVSKRMSISIGRWGIGRLGGHGSIGGCRPVWRISQRLFRRSKRNRSRCD